MIFLFPRDFGVRYTTIFDKTGSAISPGSIGGYTQSNTAVSSVTTAIQNPNTYYYAIVSGNYTWYGFADISLWSDYSSNSKSIYDPCPYGYRVPKNGSWNGFTANNLGSVKIENGSTWSSTWWPIAGGRSNGSGAIVNVGATAYYWSSSRYSSAYTSYNLYFDCSGTVYPSNGNGRSTGFSVRCVQEEAHALACLSFSLLLFDDALLYIAFYWGKRDGARMCTLGIVGGQASGGGSGLQIWCGTISVSTN